MILSNENLLLVDKEQLNEFHSFSCHLIEEKKLINDDETTRKVTPNDSMTS